MYRRVRWDCCVGLGNNGSFGPAGGFYFNLQQSPRVTHLKTHIVFSSFSGCVVEKCFKCSSAARFVIYVTFDASLISNSNMSRFSTVQNHLQPKRKCGPGVGKGHRSGESRACGLVDRGKYFVISRVQLVQIQHCFRFTPRTRIWLQFQ